MHQEIGPKALAVRSSTQHAPYVTSASTITRSHFENSLTMSAIAFA